MTIAQDVMLPQRVTKGCVFCQSQSVTNEMKLLL